MSWKSDSSTQKRLRGGFTFFTPPAGIGHSWKINSKLEGVIYFSLAPCFRGGLLNWIKLISKTVNEQGWINVLSVALYPILIFTISYLNIWQHHHYFCQTTNIWPKQCSPSFQTILTYKDSSIFWIIFKNNIWRNCATKFYFVKISKRLQGITLKEKKGKLDYILFATHI